MLPTDKELAEFSFYEYFKQAWHVIEGSTVPYVDNWHIEAIAEHLQACYEGKIKRLIINISPGCSKTSLLVAFSTWLWIKDPSKRIISASHSLGLSNKQNADSRRLIQSEWFQRNWGDKFALTKDQNVKSYFSNNKTGYRMAVSVGSKATGKRSNFILLDDPNNARDGSSVLILNKVNEWYSQELYNRLNNPLEDVIICVQQRIHELDLTGYMLKNDINHEIVRLILPMEFMTTRKCVTSIFQDPRTESGELMVPKRFPPKVLQEYKQNLGSQGYSAQYQQMPMPDEGGIIKKVWFKKWTEDYLPDFSLILQSWDTAISDKQTAAYSACTTWGVFDENVRGEFPKLILLSVWKGKLGYPELRERAYRLYMNYEDVGEKELKTKKKVDVCLIEAKATGDPLVRDLRVLGIPAIGFNPKGDKEFRVHRITPYIESGFVFLPTTIEKELKPFAEEFLKTVCMFPKGESKDVVDSMSQTLAYLRDFGNIRHPKDEKTDEEYSKYNSLYED